MDPRHNKQQTSIRVQRWGRAGRRAYGLLKILGAAPQVSRLMQTPCTHDIAAHKSLATQGRRKKHRCGNVSIRSYLAKLNCQFNPGALSRFQNTSAEFNQMVG
jgi:hypothetical protein